MKTIAIKGNKIAVRVVSLLILALGFYIFAGYVLVPHPDFLPQYIPSIIEDIKASQPIKA